ncbi:MAG: hypothetical protein HDT44_12230 [Ruminococcaceae bacterium]|nr:hypothetical protein [Oscillospiraceae bacterium]
MKLSYIKLPNEILEMNLTANELAVLFYLSSIYAHGRDSVCVKQSTIAKKCGIKTTQTVSKITTSLSEKGLIICRRCLYENNSTGMIYYTLKLPTASKGYFSVQRHILNEHLSPAQLRAYLFICRSLSPSLGVCWNSYNDLAKLIGISRSKAIEIIAQLTKKNVIRKQKIKTLTNRRVYGDNHYTVVCYVPHRPIHKRSYGKKIGLPSCKSSPAGQSANLSVTNIFRVSHNTTEKAICQVGSVFLTSFFEKVKRKKKYIHNNITIFKCKNQYIWHEKSRFWHKRSKIF